MALPDTYILIDFENVHPTDFGALEESGRLMFKVFVGATRKVLPVDFVSRLHAASRDVEYVRMDEGGNHARDFHFAFHIGRLFENDPQAVFRIISKDNGLDPLIGHMNHLGARVSRSRQFAREKPVIIESPFSGESVSSEVVDRVVSNLRNFGESRPKSVERLARTIGSWLQKKEAGDGEVVRVMEALQSRKVVSISEQRVSYALNQ